MTIVLPPHVALPESAAWTYWSSLAEAIDGAGYRVARLLDLDLELVAIGSPHATTPKPPHVWLRYQHRDGGMFGAVTLPWPSYVTTDPMSSVAVASAVAALLHAPGEPEPHATTTDAPMTVDGVYWPATITVFDSGLFVRTVVFGLGRAVAAWGPAEPPHRVQLDF